MAKKEIYDRVEICNDIISQMQDIDETQAYILYSGTGVGKTSVSKKISKLVQENNINKDVISIKSTQDDNIYEGIFLKSIFHCIRKYYLLKNNKKNKAERRKYKKYSYTYYIRHQNFSVIKKLILSTNKIGIENCKKINELIICFIKILIQFFIIKLGFIDEADTNFSDDKILIGYIKYILRKEDIVLCIENSQNLDRLSLDILMELLIETKRYQNFLVFEFTLAENSNNFNILGQIKNELYYSEINYQESELKKLDIEYVLKLVKQICDSADDSFVAKVQQMYNGNIKKVENFAFNYSVQSIDGNDPTFTLLQGLSKNQKYILAIIILNNASITERILQLILNNTNEILFLDYEEDLRYLIDNVKLLERRDALICIKDIDTVDSWNKNNKEFETYEALAYKNCEAIFLRILQNGIEYSISRKECILILFQLYNKFDAIKINNVLPMIDEVIFQIISIDELKKYIENLINMVYLKDMSLNILYNIFDICDRYQLVDLESLCLDKISKILHDSYDEKYLFCYYLNLLQKEEYQFLLDQIEQKKNRETNREFDYYVALFKISAYISLNRKDECKQIIEALENDLDFLTKPQYGYFLRLAEAFDKRNIAIPKVEKSIEIFKDFAMDSQAAKSQVSLAFLYSITGKLKKAQIVLDSAEKVLLKNIENKHVFNINKACLCLLKYNFSKEVWDLLSEAEKYTHLRFDKIAVIINKLIWCIENQDFGKGKYYEKRGLEMLELEYNHHLHAIFYYNCFALYKAMNNVEKSQEYYNLALKHKEYCDTLKARLEGKTEVEDQTTFLLQYPWHVCFVSYLNFDYIFRDGLTISS